MQTTKQGVRNLTLSGPRGPKMVSDGRLPCTHPEMRKDPTPQKYGVHYRHYCTRCGEFLGTSFSEKIEAP